MLSMKELENPFAYQLERVPWTIFGSLTFKHLRKERDQRCAYFALLRYAAMQTDTPFNKLIWALRLERGEKCTFRGHSHFLLMGRGNIKTLAFQLIAWWRAHVGSRARVQPYDAGLAGVSYVTKCLGMRYEVGRFDQAGGLYLPAILHRFLAIMDLRSGRHAGKHLGRPSPTIRLPALSFAGKL